DRSGQHPLGNSGSGVEIRGNASGNVIGGLGLGARNVIAFNGAAGVGVESGTGNTIRGNSLHDNGNLGIDLGPVGVTLDDSLDADGGANNLQNFPLLQSAVLSGTTITLTGSINTTPNTTVTLDFYASPSPDTSGFGEGTNLI